MNGANSTETELLRGASDQPVIQEAPRSSFRFLAVCAAFMLGGILFLAWLGTAPRRSIQGQQFPQFLLQPLMNADQPLSRENLIGQTTVVLLWSPEQPAGADQLRQLQQIIAHHDHIAVVTVAYSQATLNMERLQSLAAEQLQRLNLTWPSYVDVQGAASIDFALLMPYGSFGFPTLFVTDQRGCIIQVSEGDSPETWRQVEDAIATNRRM